MRMQCFLILKVLRKLTATNTVGMFNKLVMVFASDPASMTIPTLWKNLAPQSPLRSDIGRLPQVVSINFLQLDKFQTPRHIVPRYSYRHDTSQHDCKNACQTLLAPGQILPEEPGSARCLRRVTLTKTYRRAVSIHFQLLSTWERVVELSGLLFHFSYYS